MPAQRHSRIAEGLDAHKRQCIRRAQICMGKPASAYESSPLGRITGYSDRNRFWDWFRVANDSITNAEDAATRVLNE